MSNIKFQLLKPTHCDNCCSLNIELATNYKIYGRFYDDWPKIWFCNDCGAAVGCHPGTEIPLGQMADQKIRKLRAKAHEHFDKLWKKNLMSRSKAYQWLAGALKIQIDECHISLLSENQLNKTIEVSAKHFEDNFKALQRRKVKKDEKRRKKQLQERRQRKTNIRLRKAKGCCRPNFARR